ncbi:DsbA family oxidoreductase [Streptomyces sp. PT12]|uniref:DsbA family oxidoreductase n=1 Tax=Streptomyces sp. PT12 TaxID=1510197 RepID=UPI000DE56B6F|nr:DsbA family oxidoreductase [Streptomyces sp. PT12]RBM07310.1 disulfide bond formation protein DsbA [Streptomyces sp. PT12]
MRIEVWADMVCPWAYIGKRRLEKALADPALAGLYAEVVWRPYRIDPTAPAQATPVDESSPDAVTDGDAASRTLDPSPAQDRVLVSQVAAEEGFGPEFGAAWRADSLDAHGLLALAYEHGGSVPQDQVAERLLHAHFLDHLDISDRRLLDGIADRAGIPDAGTLLDGGAAAREVRELLLIGKARGIATSPTIVVGDRALAGAQPPAVMADFITAAASVPIRETPEEVQRLRWSESLLDQRDPLGALTLLQPLLAHHGDDLNVRRLAARSYFHSAQLSRAHDMLRQLVADAPDDSYTRLMLGRTLQRLGRDDEAVMHLKMVAAMTPEFA